MTSYCVFNVGERRIGIPMADVREIIEPGQVQAVPVPLTPAFVHGLFNLRGQVLPSLDLSPFVGAAPVAEAEAVTATRGRDERAVIVERGPLRFATVGRRITTVEADESMLQPLASGALYPALEAEAQTDRGNFAIVHLDRLAACLAQGLKFAESTETASPPTAAAR